jgi:hypothetical protein
LVIVPPAGRTEYRDHADHLIFHFFIEHQKKVAGGFRATAGAR